MGHKNIDVVVVVVPRAEANEFVNQLHASRQGMAVALLLGGQRWACCTHAALATIGGNPVGIATISPRGESNTGEPTVVGMYVLREHRREGIGAKLLAAAVRWLRDLVPGQPVRLDILHSAVWLMVERLPPELRELVDATDQMPGGVMDAALEA